MKYKLTHSENSERLILIFAGWSTDADFYSHIFVGGYDVMVVYDYSDLEFPVEILDKYTTVCLFAWSMGVYVASSVIPPDRACMKIAINGTEIPVSDEMGIPREIFKGTHDRLDERNLLKFQKRMSGSEFNKICDRLPVPDIESLKRQLETILDSGMSCSHEQASASRYPWHKVFISTADSIFPPDNQLKAWSCNPFQPQIITVDLPHYIDLSKIVGSSVPHIEVIGRNFHKALPSYSHNATAQRNIMNVLVDMIPEKLYADVLEIGPGSGDFSKSFSSRFHPASMTYVDLYQLPKFGFAPKEDYHRADAESWMRHEAENNPETYDVVISSSTIQWFIDPVSFIRNASKVLRPGGVLACSTFLPGNLKELSATNPFGILYHRAEELLDELKADYSSVESKEMEETVTFNNSRETLAHLSRTGAGGSADSGIPVSEILRKLGCTLTYSSFLFVATK